MYGTKKIEQTRCLVVAWCLRALQRLCVGLARGYQWRLAWQGESQQERDHAILNSVYTQGVLRGMSRGANLAVREIRTAMQDSDAQLKWSPWLSFLARASYVYGALLLATHEADSLTGDGISAIF